MFEDCECGGNCPPCEECDKPECECECNLETEGEEEDEIE